MCAGSRIEKVLKIPISQLLIPGPRSGNLLEVPYVPIAGSANASVRKLRLNVRSLLGSVGSARTSTRATSVGDPLISMAVVVVKLTPTGRPLTKLAIPDTCQPFSTALAAMFRHGVLGTSQSQVICNEGV